MEDIIFRAKHIHGGSFSEWIIGSLIKAGDNDYQIATLIGHDYYESLWIDKNTIGEFIGYKDDNDVLIFTDDVLEFTRGDGVKTRYLVWFNKETHFYSAVLVDDNIGYNGYDYYNTPITWEDFTLMIQNVYGDFTSVKIIGNIVENKDLVQVKLGNIIFRQKEENNK